MEKILKQSLLYDFYGVLLNNHQKNIYEEYIINDMSLSEIAEQQGISRQGVHDIIKRCDKALEEYEEKLFLVEKFLGIKKLTQELCTDIDKMRNNHDEKILNKMEKIAKEILEKI